MHPVVELMLARMESHPQEFENPYGSRWSTVLEGINEYAEDAEREIVRKARYKILMGRVHEEALDELCNGEERRRKAEEEKNQAMIAQRTLLQQQGAKSGLLGNTLSGSLSGSTYQQTQRAMTDAEHQRLIEQMLNTQGLKK